MPHVNVEIAGHSYRMACEAGEEERLTMLAGRFDRTVEDLRGRVGEIGDRRLAVMAGLLLLDDLEETERRNEDAEAEITRLAGDVARLQARLHELSTQAPKEDPAAAEARRQALEAAIVRLDALTAEIRGAASEAAGFE